MKTTTKIAKANLRENKSRSLLICISIMLTTMLLTIIALFAYGVIKEEKVNAGVFYGEYFGGYEGVNKEIFEKIKIHGEFYDIGRLENFATVSLEKAEGILSFVDETARQLGKVSTCEGTFPTKENEIAGQKGFFRGAGLKNPKIGDKVCLKYRVHHKVFTTKEFVICGFIDEGEKNDLNKRYGAYVSEDFYGTEVSEKEQNYSVVFKVKNEENLDIAGMQEKIESLAVDLGVEKKQVIINKNYLFGILEPDLETIGVCCVIAVLVILFSVLVIYNIFYVGIIQKIQEYGKFRAIGTTKKQIKNILLKEGMILAGIGTTVGLVLGLLVTHFMFSWLCVKMYENMSVSNIEKISVFNLPLLLLVALVSFVTVYISLLKPMRIASRIAPVEAMRYHEESVKGKGVRKGFSSVNVVKLTMSNLARNKKRTLTTILIMGLSGIMFVVIANIAGNMDAAFDARYMVEKGDFYISLNYDLNDTVYPENNLNHIQQKDLMGEKWLNQIRSIDGVTKVETRNIIRVLREKVTGEENEEELYATVRVLSKEDYQKLEVSRGKLNYDTAKKKNEIVYGYDTWMETEGYAIGDEVKLTFFDGDKEIPKTFTLTGSTETSAMFIMTEEQFESMNFKENLTTDVWVSCEKNKIESVQKALEQMTVENEYYEMVSYQDAYKESKMAIASMQGGAYALLGIIGVIGFMNMANTLITSIITRRKELGILQAIGMTKKQLNYMLQMEGLIFTVGVLIVTLSLGNVLGYLAWAKCKADGVIGIETYSLPVAELVIMTGILLFMQIILSAFMSGHLQKETLIERIRHQE